MLLNILQKLVVGGQCETGMACAFHCLMRAFGKDFVAILYARSEHIYRARWRGLWLVFRRYLVWVLPGTSSVLQVFLIPFR